MESGPIGMRQSRSREGFPTLNIRTGLSSWICHWTQPSYTKQSALLLSSLTMSSSSTSSPTIFRDGSNTFGDSIRQLDMSKKPEGYLGPSEVRLEVLVYLPH